MEVTWWFKNHNEWESLENWPDFLKFSIFMFHLNIHTLTFRHIVLNQSICGIWRFRFVHLYVSVYLFPSLHNYYFVGVVDVWRMVIYHSTDSQQLNSPRARSRISINESTKCPKNVCVEGRGIIECKTNQS